MQWHEYFCHLLPWVPEVIFFVSRRKITRRSRGHEARSAERKTITSGRTNTEPHFCVVLSPGKPRFSKPIVVLVSCRLGNHAFRKPITIVVSFEEPINELGQILSYFTYPKHPRIENFKPKKVLRSSQSLEIRSTPPPP